MQIALTVCTFSKRRENAWEGLHAEQRLQSKSIESSQVAQGLVGYSYYYYYYACPNPPGLSPLALDPSAIQSRIDAAELAHSSSDRGLNR